MERTFHPGDCRPARAVLFQDWEWERASTTAGIQRGGPAKGMGRRSRENPIRSAGQTAEQGNSYQAPIFVDRATTEAIQWGVESVDQPGPRGPKGPRDDGTIQQDPPHLQRRRRANLVGGRYLRGLARDRKAEPEPGRLGLAKQEVVTPRSARVHQTGQRGRDWTGDLKERVGREVMAVGHDSPDHQRQYQDVERGRSRSPSLAHGHPHHSSDFKRQASVPGTHQAGGIIDECLPKG